MKKKEISPHAYLRCFDAFPQIDSLDFYLDDQLYIKDILYEDFSEYTTISPGEHTLFITPHDDPTVLCIRQLWISKDRIYTLILSLDFKCQLPSLYLMNDVQRTIPENHCLLRIGHFSTLDQMMRIALGDEINFKKVLPHQMTHYLAFEPKTYDVHVKSFDAEEALYTLPKCQLKFSRFYTFYLIGKGTKDFPLKLVLSIDGSSFLCF